jgi:hypothetical protein
MRILEAINKINKSPGNESYVDIIDIANRVNVSLYDYIDCEDLKCYYLRKWLCTDTMVGTRVYFLRGEPVAVSIQEGRKCDENFKWLSHEWYSITREYVLSLVAEPDSNFEILEDEEIGDTYKVEYVSQIICDTAFYQGVKVDILEKEHYSVGKINFHSVVILHEGEEKTIDCRDLDFSYHIEKDEEA